MDEVFEPRPSVHCCSCSRLVFLPEGDGPGAEIRCVFCGTMQVVREMTVLVSEPVSKP